MARQSVLKTHVLYFLNPILAGITTLYIEAKINFTGRFFIHVANDEPSIHSFARTFYLRITLLFICPALGLVRKTDKLLLLPSMLSVKKKNCLSAFFTFFFQHTIIAIPICEFWFISISQ